MVKLFSAKSCIEGFLGFKEVNFFWYCKERKNPAFPYDEVIMDYVSLDEMERGIAERYIDDHFTESETEELKEYLRGVYQIELELRRIQLPMIYDKTFDDSYPLSLGFSCLFPLYNDEGYDLTIPIMAKYYLDELFSITWNRLPSIHQKFGKMFADSLLKKLNIFPPDNLGEIIEEIYTEKFLFVSRH